MRIILLLLLFISPLKIFASAPRTLESDTVYDLQPVVWRITVEGHHLYMIGTAHHMSYDDCPQRTRDAIDEAFAGSPQIMLSEAGDFSGRDIRGYIDYLMSRPGVVLQTNIPAEDLSQYNALLKQGWLTRRLEKNPHEFDPELPRLISQGFGVEFFDPLHPLIFLGMKHLFGKIGESLDVGLTTRFSNAFPSAAVLALDEPERVMTTLIDTAVKGIQDVTIDEIVSAIEAGTLFHKPITVPNNLVDDNNFLFDGRNQTWWPRIKDALRNHESVLVVVGRAHLDLGNFTLLGLLRTDFPEAFMEKIA